MRFSFRNLVLISAALCATAAFADEQKRVEVPFSFVAKHHAYQAGSYTVAVDWQRSVVTLSEVGRSSQPLMWIIVPGAVDPTHPKVSLTFDVSGQEHVLERSSMSRSPRQTWMGSQSIGWRAPPPLASSLDTERSRSMGPFGKSGKGAFCFFANNAHRSLSAFLRSPELELKMKRGHAVGGQVGVEYGENGRTLLDHQAIKSDESRRIVYLEKKTPACSDSSQNCWSRMSSYARCMRGHPPWPIDFRRVV